MDDTQTKVFKNDSTEVFVHSYDGRPYKFPPGREMYLEAGIANLFAKHWTDQQINQLGGLTSDGNLRAPLLQRCLPSLEDVPDLEDLIDANKKEDKKRGNSVKIGTEEEFEGLN